MSEKSHPNGGSTVTMSAIVNIEVPVTELDFALDIDDNEMRNKIVSAQQSATDADVQEPLPRNMNELRDDIVVARREAGPSYDTQSASVDGDSA